MIHVMIDLKTLKIPVTTDTGWRKVKDCYLA
jgi:hypothetical protein